MSDVLLPSAVGLKLSHAYATTAAAACHIGAGNRQAAISLGIGGLWLALILGAILAGFGTIFAEPLLDLLNAEGHIMPHAKAYLLWSLPGLPGMLLVLAATGVLRGLLDTRDR